MNEQRLVGLVAIDTVPADFADDVIPCGAIAAAIRRAQTCDEERDSLDHHAAVVAWCRRAAFLPSRTGIAISPQLLQSVAQSARSYRARLEHVVDCVEISVEFDRRDDALRRAAEAGGRAYLRAAAVDLGACEVGIATAASLLAMLSERVDADLIVRTAPLPSLRLRAAVLVKRTVAPRLAQRVEATLNAISARLVCRVSGPWPPYSFSTIEESS
jgi:gas vesicle protein GvpL/GvpF